MGHRKNGMILSRRPDLDNIIADKLRKLFGSFGVEPYSLSFVDQRHGCTGMLKSKADHDRVISLGPLNINRKPEP
ncbi:apolipoprotein D-like [Tropilaelaps mercedesae]|uniref:Apolipoprotein D-like n=1 Tax=Tropilaelaps mercedesae TaxID=418985 RepID=A0A1V9WYL5_9ACAR|nr:apolipoprotein D-like [Tropilaelaps mercedesae]